MIAALLSNATRFEPRAVASRALPGRLARNLATSFGHQRPRSATGSTGRCEIAVNSAELVRMAAAVIRPHRAGDRLFGDVGAAVLSSNGTAYVGVSIDTSSGTGFCAEHSAIAAMVSAGEYRIASIVAVWRNEAGELYVLPPCGRCREFMRQVDAGNLDAEVIIGPEETARLRELLPLTEWPAPLPRS